MGAQSMDTAIKPCITSTAAARHMDTASGAVVVDAADSGPISEHGTITMKSHADSAELCA